MGPRVRPRNPGQRWHSSWAASTPRRGSMAAHIRHVAGSARRHERRGGLPMPAYFLLNGRYFNPDRTAMNYYVAHVRPTVAAHGGRYRRALTHRVEVIEGAWHPRALGMIEFPTFAQAKAWYDSPEYAPLKAIRLANVRNDT